MHQSISYVDFECKSDKGSEVYLVDDPKPTHVHDIKVMNILKTNMYILCNVPGCWF